jgi:hypothetical protein
MPSQSLTEPSQDFYNFRMKKIALVLSSGGPRGAAHVGVLKVLEEQKVPHIARRGQLHRRDDRWSLRCRGERRAHRARVAQDRLLAHRPQPPANPAHSWLVERRSDRTLPQRTSWRRSPHRRAAHPVRCGRDGYRSGRARLVARRLSRRSDPRKLFHSRALRAGGTRRTPPWPMGAWSARSLWTWRASSARKPSSP